MHQRGERGALARNRRCMRAIKTGGSSLRRNRDKQTQRQRRPGSAPPTRLCSDAPNAPLLSSSAQHLIQLSRSRLQEAIRSNDRQRLASLRCSATAHHQPLRPDRGTAPGGDRAAVHSATRVLAAHIILRRRPTPPLRLELPPDAPALPPRPRLGVKPGWGNQHRWVPYEHPAEHHMRPARAGPRLLPRRVRSPQPGSAADILSHG